MEIKHKLENLEQVLKDLNSTEMGRRAFIQALPLLLAACASTDKSRYREGDNAGQDAKLTVDEEKRMTEQVLPEMRKDYPPIQNAQLQQYVSSLGNKLIEANNLDGNPYHYTFTAVDVPYVNAFALPAGTVFVTAPLIEMADSEAELMGVIGHEVGHIKARHTSERMFKAEKEKNKSLLYGAGGGVLGGILGYGIGKIACPPKDKKCLQKAALIGAGAGAAGGLLIQKYGFMANSREDEMEADRIGFKTALQAGYSKDHIGKFYDKLLLMEKQSKKDSGALSFINDAMSTHPPSDQRVQQMHEMAANTSNTDGAIINTPQFGQMKGIASQYAQRARSRAQKS